MIHNDSTVVSAQGFKKTIDEASLSFVLNNLQVDQYKYPVKSTIRELTSNAVDSIAEKKIALAILNGEAKVEDYYLTRDEDIYKSSNFNASYYDPKYLSTNNQVSITYHETSEPRDYIIIKDTGVGLGGKRLEGYFQLAFSSKRNTKSTLGKFGIGSKSPLSTGIDSFTMTSYYNGRKYMFDIYTHKVDSLIPKFNKDGKNGLTIFYEGTENETPIYYEETDELNGVEIKLSVKKHNKQTYYDAVKSQLLYFDNVSFYIYNDDHKTSYNVDFKANILYEDNDIILSDNSMFSRPHIVIGNEFNKVNYGLIDFSELEIQQYTGNIGIKVESEEVSINPSRESVIWDEITRQAILNKFKKAMLTATQRVEASIDNDSLMGWLKTVTTTWVNNSDPVLNKLTKIVDRSQIAFTYKDKYPLQAPNLFFKGFEVKLVSTSYDYGSYRMKISREPLTAWPTGPVFDRFYLRSSSHLHRVDDYMYQTFGDFVTIRPKLDVTQEVFDGLTPAQQQEELQIRAYRDTLLKELSLPKYEDIVVPDDYKIRFKDNTVDGTIIDEPEAVKAPELTAKERRKLNELILVHEPELKSYHQLQYNTESSVYYKRVEISRQQINNIRHMIVYGTEEDSDALDLLYQYGFTSIIIYKVAKAVVKEFTNCKHVNDFFMSVQGSEVVADDRLKNWYTARLIQPELPRMSFLENYSLFDEDIHEKYKKLVEFVKRHYSSNTLLNKTYANDKLRGKMSTLEDTFIEYLDKVKELELFVDNHLADKELIGEKAKALFNNSEISNGKTLNMNIYKTFQEVLDYIPTYEHIFNYVGPLLNPTRIISQELEQEIKAIIKNKSSVQSY